MLYFTVINWILISFFGILYFFTTIMPLIIVKDNVKNVYLHVLSYLFATIIFISLKDVVNVKASIITWKILVGIPWALSIVIFFYKGRSPHKYIIFVLNTIFGSVPFLINAKFHIPVQELNISYFINNYTLDSLMSMISVICLLMAALLVGLTISRNNSLKLHIDKRLGEQEIQSQQFSRNYIGIYNQLHALNSNIKKIQPATVSNPELYITLNNFLKDFPKFLKQIQTIKEQGPSATKIESPQIINDINHSIATPLSQININCEFIKSAEHKKEISLFANRIQRHIQLCHCIIQGYKDLVDPNNTDDQTNIADMLQDAFDVYKHDSQKQNIIFSQKLNNIQEGYSSKLLVSIICPLIQNAVTASPDGETIFIEGNIKNGTKQIVIKNICESLPNNDLLDKIGYSSKKDHIGIGLDTVRTLLKLSKYGVLKYNIDKETATATFIIDLS